MSLPLSETEALFLDIQATHPHKGYIFEMGWLFAAADCIKETAMDALVSQVQDYLIRPPSGEIFTAPIKRITGITDEEILKGSREARIRKKLNIQLGQRMVDSATIPFPTIIHYRRYEESLLKQMYKKKQAGLTGFPFEIICTHQIVSRLLPNLPRKGIRACAGYFNIHLPETKRSGWHVAATAKIWCHLLNLLEQQGVTTYEDLKKWISEQSTIRGMTKPKGRVYPMAESSRVNLPDEPGVYRLRRKNGDLLYIGKATSLKQRLNSYFQKGAKHSERILEMLTQAQQLDFTITQTALEAALIESDEIKQKSPIYNRALRGENRKTAFFTPDLANVTCTYQPGYPIGPLPSPESLLPLSMILGYLKKGFPKKVGDEELERLFQVNHQYLPEAGMCHHGYKLFYSHHEAAINTPPLLFALINLGKQQWLKRLEELAAQKEEELQVEEEPDEEGEEKEIIAWTWTPERIARALEGMVRRGTFFIRRSRWFNMLCESTIGWQEKNRGKKQQVMLLQNGAIIKNEDSQRRGELPIPPGHNKPLPERQQQINYMTYERLRVLTTELKRMLISGHTINVRLSPGITLKTEQLRELMRWL